MINDYMMEIQDLLWQVNGRKIVELDRLAIQKGEMIGLIGPNGAGKSSLIKLLALLETPTAGKIFFKGQPITGQPLSVKRQMATVFQEPLLLSGTVYENIALGLKIRKVPRGMIRRKVKEWLQQLKIEHLADQNVYTLSGGEAQRVSLARAMIMEPEILFLDEPFSALDLPTRAALLQDFSEIIRNMGVATVFVTHHVSEIPLMANRVCVLANGQIIQDDRPETVLNYPNHHIVAKLVGIDNVLQADVIETTKDSRVISLENDLKLTVSAKYQVHKGDAVTVFIRPDDISIIKGETAVSQTDNLLQARINKIIPMDTQFKIFCNTEPNLVLLVSRGVFLDAQLEVGKIINISIPEDKIHLVKEEMPISTKVDESQKILF